jgi:hypothetical protein
MFGYIDESGNVVYINMLEDTGADEDGSAAEPLSADIAVPVSVAGLSLDNSSTVSVAADEALVGGSSSGKAAVPETTVPSVSSPMKQIAVKAAQSTATQPALTPGAIVCQQNLSKYFLNRTEPSPRINPCIMIRGSTLYVYGGVTELGDVEITLDDCWSLDLNKRDKWRVCLPGTMHTMVWKGEDYDTGTEVLLYIRLLL